MAPSARKHTKSGIPKINKKDAGVTPKKGEKVEVEKEEVNETKPPTESASTSQNSIETEEERRTKEFYEWGNQSGIENSTAGWYEHIQQDDGSIVSSPVEPRLVISRHHIGQRFLEKATTQQMLVDHITSQNRIIEGLKIELQRAQSTIQLLRLPK